MRPQVVRYYDHDHRLLYVATSEGSDGQVGPWPPLIIRYSEREATAYLTWSEADRAAAEIERVELPAFVRDRCDTCGAPVRRPEPWRGMTLVRCERCAMTVLVMPPGVAGVHYRDDPDDWAAETA